MKLNMDSMSFMSLLIDSSNLHRSNMHSLLKGLFKPIVLKLQREFRLFPREICLITGAPRSGTTALCEWLGQQKKISVFTESRILVSVHGFMEEILRFKNLNKDKAIITNLARNLVYDYYSNSRILLGKRMVVDKEPLEPTAFPSKEYGQFILNVKKLFPESKFLLAIRHPVATIWSMSQRTWGESLMDMETKRFTLEEYIDNWCSCADLILHYSSDPNSYIVQFGRLINDPENESKRIFGFLNIRKGILFQPRQTNKNGFSNEEQENILQRVKPQLELLNSHGISDLS